MEALEERDRDEDEDCLLAVADLDLYIEKKNPSQKNVHIKTVAHVVFLAVIPKPSSSSN